MSVSDSMWQRLPGLRMEAITGEWRTCQKELHNLFLLPNIIRVNEDKMYGVCGINGIKAHRV